jgi:hypothetical protein
MDAGSPGYDVVAEILSVTGAGALACTGDGIGEELIIGWYGSSAPGMATEGCSDAAGGLSGIWVVEKSVVVFVLLAGSIF